MKEYEIYLDPCEVWDEVLDDDYTPYVCIAEDNDAGMQVFAGYDTENQQVIVMMEVCAQGNREAKTVVIGTAQTKNECKELVSKIFLEFFNYESKVEEIEEDDTVLTPWSGGYYEDDADLWQLREMEIDEALEQAISTIAGMRSQDFMNSNDIAECKRQMIGVVEMYCGLM